MKTKTEVRHEHGDWIVFVDDNPQFSFMYREEAEKVRNMIEVLNEFVYKYEHGNGNSSFVDRSLSSTCRYARKSLKDIGAI